MLNVMEIPSANSEVARRLNRQFWVVVLILILPRTVFCAEVTMDFTTMLSALKNNAVPIIHFVVATAYVIGIWFVISAIKDLKQVGQSQSAATHGGIGGPLIKLIIGVLLIYLPSAVDVGVASLWGHGILGSDAGGYMSYTPNESDPFTPAKEGAIAIVRVVGYVSFVRGLVILSHSSDQGAQAGTFSKGFMHIIGGILAINIVETVRIIGNTLGITII